jgi:predicted CXXCH cytochrome family protein
MLIGLKPVRLLAYLAAFAVVVVAAASIIWRNRIPDSPHVGPVMRRGAEVSPAPEAYVGRSACAACHAAEGRAFATSDHAHAMGVANDSTVLGRFGGDSLSHPGGGFRFLKQSGAYFIRAPGQDGMRLPYQVRYVFGVKPLQQYLVEFPGGRLQAMPAAWDSRSSQWFHLRPDSAVAPDDWLHWTRDGQNWNGMCADCHSTGLRRGYDIEKGIFATEWKEIEVSCEACHGPAADHVDWARSGALKRFFMTRSRKENMGLHWDHTRTSAWTGYRNGKDSLSGSSGAAGRGNSLSPAAAAGFSGLERSGAREQVMACARCHARRSALQRDFRYAREFLDEYVPDLLTEGIYQPDGQIQNEDYEYGSFLQSRMYHAGVACADCHDPHSLKLRANGNALCTRCHEPERFDSPRHHRHLAGRPGGLCVECHMPTRTYMQNDVRRDHSLRVPRPDQSVAYGTANACGACHAERGPGWAAAKITEWHGSGPKPHFSDLLTQGRKGGPGADSALAALAGDTAWPEIARATAVSLLAGYMNGLARASLLAGMSDHDPLVRWAAATGSDWLPQSERVQALAPLLHDSLRAVRTAAAASLLDVAPLLADSLRLPFAAAFAEHREALEANAFFPTGRFNLGRFHEIRGRDDSAVVEYRAALGIDNRFLPARMNLAQLYARHGRADSAVVELGEALRFNPGYAEAHYSLGLLYGEAGPSDSAAFHLAAAEAAMPGNARVSYNLGLVFAKMDRLDAGEAALRRSLAAKEAPECLYALAWLLSRVPKPAEAESLLRRLEALSPGYPGADGLRAVLASRRLSR